MAKQIYVAALTMIVIAAVIYLLHEKILFVWKEVHRDTAAFQLTDKESKRLMVSAYAGVPERLDFCGEEVPLYLIDVKEKLDAELLFSAYMHANTLQTLNKAAKYFPVIEPILKEEGIPEDFKYLAIIGNGSDNSTSPLEKAGFWQLSQAVALQYGLVVSEEVDERLHLAKSTKAACQYLKAAYQKFGNWTLAAVAYSTSMEEIAQAVNVQKVNTYYDLFLNKEVNRLIFKILAFKEIIQNPRKYRFEPKDSKDTLPMRTIKVEKTIPDLVAFAKAQGVSYKTLKSYNEWLLADHLTVKDTTQWLISLPLQ